MSTHHPFGWDLPPGCTDRDIERAMGGDIADCPDCKGTGKSEVSNCCGAPFDAPGFPDNDICSQCHEHAEQDDCTECEGTGVINIEDRKAQAREDAEIARWEAKQEEERCHPRDRFLDDEQ